MQQSELLFSIILRKTVVLQNEIDSWIDLQNEKSTKSNVFKESGVGWVLCFLKPESF